MPEEGTSAADHTDVEQSTFPRMKIELFVGIMHQRCTQPVNLSVQLGMLGEVHGEEIWYREVA